MFVFDGVLGPGSEMKWFGSQSYPPEGKWDSTATKMVKRFQESGHPVWESISALARRILNRKNNRDTVHFTADALNTEILYRTIHSANQLSIYGAVAGWCEEFGLKPDESSDMLTRTENEQIMKEVRPQEVNSLVKAQRNEDIWTASNV